jgi:methane monooxygenase PmoA-like
MRFPLPLLVAFASSVALPLLLASSPPPPKVEVTPNPSQRRVDVRVDGAPFTSYIWPERLKKAVLFPIRTAKGTLVTRGFPLEPRPGERVDHPHHVGLWFNYGDVNGVDFWNNAETLAPEQQAKMGTIRHRTIEVAKGGAGQGELEVDSDWVMPDGSVVLREHTRYIFRAGPDWRSIDRITGLTAGDKRVSFTDNKEGVLGLRVTRALEEPSDKPEVFTDAQGRPTAVPAMDNKGVNGVYLSSEGKKGGAVWGTRGRWTVLQGTVEGEPVTLGILDHPGNPGFPTYWHARGYGLFAANPLGQAALSDGKEKLGFALEPKASTTFRHRILVVSGTLTPAQVEARYQEFVAAK